MIETLTIAVMTFIATIGPLDVVAIFAALTANATPRERRSMALRGTLVAAVVLLVFALIGERLLSSLGISLAALRTAGGILLLLIGIDLVFARSSGGTSTTQDETREAVAKKDISVFPLATPLIAGPGSMGAAILLMSNASNDLTKQAIVIGGMLAVLLLTLIGLLLATQMLKLMGVTAMHVISRIFGIILCALAVQFVFDGILQSGLIPS